jgi:hypothetical protein
MASSQTDNHRVHNLTLDIDPSMIPRFIGRGGSGIKDQIIKPSWKLFNHFKGSGKIKSDNGSTEEPKESLHVLVSEGGGGVIAKITCHSEEMLKFALKSLNDYIVDFSKPRESSFHYIHFYTIAEHHMIARFIGRGGQNIKAFTRDIGSLLSEDELSRNDLSVSIKPFHIKEDSEGGDALAYLNDKTFAFVNSDGVVSDSVVTEDGSMIFVVIKVNKSVSGDKSEDDLYGDLNDTVVRFLKPTHRRNPELEAEIDLALGENYL